MRSAWSVLTAAVLAGCYNPHDVGSCVLAACPPDGGTPDGGSDAETGQNCYGSTAVRICFAAPPTGDVVLDRFSTDNCVVQGGAVHTIAALGLDVCVLAANTVSVPGNAVITGGLPLVIIAVDKVLVESGGVLDGSSSTMTFTLGPGANAAACAVPNASAGRQGGPGGSFGGVGGRGALNGPGGQPVLATAFHGGCKGGTGDVNLTPGGRGGGALFLISDGSIQIDGAVMACGAGGHGAQGVNRGGGGGGSGGYIGLDSPSISISGPVYAIGGGGGGGSDANLAGDDGGEANPTSTTAVGGVGPMGADGGAGGDANNGGDGAGSVSSGGGGGGGSTGVIQLFRATGACSPNCVPERS